MVAVRFRHLNVTLVNLLITTNNNSNDKLNSILQRRIEQCVQITEQQGSVISDSENGHIAARCLAARARYQIEALRCQIDRTRDLYEYGVGVSEIYSRLPQSQLTSGCELADAEHLQRILRRFQDQRIRNEIINEEMSRVSFAYRQPKQKKVSGPIRRKRRRSPVENISKVKRRRRRPQYSYNDFVPIDKIRSLNQWKKRKFVYNLNNADVDINRVKASSITKPSAIKVGKLITEGMSGRISPSHFDVQSNYGLDDLFYEELHRPYLEEERAMLNNQQRLETTRRQYKKRNKKNFAQSKKQSVW